MYCEYDQNHLIQLLSRYGMPSAPVDNAIVDSFGVVTPIECVPYIEQLAGTVIARPPYPDDGTRSSFIEYVPLIESIASATGPAYQMMELGASYAPFTAICGVLAKRHTSGDIMLLACEAAPKGIERLYSNLTANGLLADQRIKVQVVRGAVAARGGHVYFPDVDCAVDNGGNIKGLLSKLGSIGSKKTLARVKAYTISTLLGMNNATAPVDFVHCDVQGAEYDVFSSCMPLLDKRVRRVFVATHSRQIEERLFTLFDRRGWHLVAEDPCQMRYRGDGDARRLHLATDGGQYWRNRLLT